MKQKTDLVIEAYLIYNNRLLLVHHTKLNKWLPPGGHIEPNETPDEAVIREVNEETGLDIEIVNKKELPKDPNIITQLALPFYADVHSVGDHNHACLYYLCKPKNDNVKISKESRDHKWITLEELISSPEIQSDVKKIGKLAFEKIKSVN
jgi:8-oxo-dGTP pyrophosphatase MutT (NUDIX family)